MDAMHQACRCTGDRPRFYMDLSSSTFLFQASPRFKLFQIQKDKVLPKTRALFFFSWPRCYHQASDRVMPQKPRLWVMIGHMEEFKAP